MNDGNFIATSNRYDMFENRTIEDIVIIIDRETGKVIKEYDFNEIVDNTREMYHHSNSII